MGCVPCLMVKRDMKSNCQFLFVSWCHDLVFIIILLSHYTSSRILINDEHMDSLQTNTNKYREPPRALCIYAEPKCLIICCASES